MLRGFTVEVLPEVDSTNSELLRRFKGNAGAPYRPEPLLLVAERQSAGRGRLGRSWQSERGASLTFSLGLPLQPTDWSGLSLAVGVSVAESLDPPPTRQPHRGGQHRIGLKWPNDLWLTTAQGERKLAGILVETASWEGLRYVVIGVGVNIEPVTLATGAETAAATAAIAPGCLRELGACRTWGVESENRPQRGQFLPDLQAHSPSMGQKDGEKWTAAVDLQPTIPKSNRLLDSGIDAPQTLLRIVPALVQALQAFERFGFAPFHARFAARDVLAGRAVRLSDGSQGTAQGVAGNGALRLLTAAGMQEISSAEVSVRPLAAPHHGKNSLPC